VLESSRSAIDELLSIAPATPESNSRPVLQIRLRQHAFVHHLTAQHLDRDELYQDLLPRAGVADLGFQIVLDRVDVFACVCAAVEVREGQVSLLLNAPMRRFLRRAIEGRR